MPPILYGWPGAAGLPAAGGAFGPGAGRPGTGAGPPLLPADACGTGPLAARVVGVAPPEAGAEFAVAPPAAGAGEPATAAGTDDVVAAASPEGPAAAVPTVAAGPLASTVGDLAACFDPEEHAPVISTAATRATATLRALTPLSSSTPAWLRREWPPRHPSLPTAAYMSNIRKQAC